MSDLPIKLFSIPLFSSVSLAANQSSAVQDISEVGCYCLQADWSGTSPVGTLTIQASTNNVTFDNIQSNAITGNTGSLIVNVERPAYFYFKLIYTATSGTGTLSATISAKRI